MKVCKCLLFSVFLYRATFAYHPFLGQYADAPTLTRPDGTITMRLKEKPVKYNKYDHIIDKSLDERKGKTII